MASMLQAKAHGMGKAAVCAVGLLCAAESAHAADRVLLELPVTYDADAGVVQNVKKTCKIEDQLVAHVGPVLAKRNQSGGGTLAAGGDPQGAARLRLTITHVLGVGGGGGVNPATRRRDAWTT